MWEQLTPADLARAKAQAATLRRNTLARHAEELRVLDAEEAEIELLEGLIGAFTGKYMASQPGGAVNGPATAPPLDETANATDSLGADQKVLPPRLQVQQNVSPNFVVPVRRLLRR